MAKRKPETNRGKLAASPDTTTGQSRRKPAKAKSVSSSMTTAVSRTGKPVVLLSGGNPQIAKADGDAPVQEYINAMPDWKYDIGRWLDTLIEKTVPNVRKAVRWNTPFYGIEGNGWFMGFHCLTKYVKVAFFRGTSLQPNPPGASNQTEVRYLDIYQDRPIDEKLLTSWIRQASELPGDNCF